MKTIYMLFLWERLTPLTTFINWSVFKINICCFLIKLLSDNAFSIAFHINFLSAMHGLRDNEVLLPKDMTSSSVLRQGALHAIFYDGFWKSDHDFQIVLHSNFLSAMHGFRVNDVLLQAGYVVIVISPPGGAPRDFSWRILKERPWLLDSVLW